MKILIVEDEIEMINTITDSLSDENYIIETSSDFNSASEKLSLYSYDCILLDIMIPGGSGLELLAQLKKEDKSGSVIIISAKDSVDDKVEGLGLGADDYLPKPFHAAELRARIKAVLRRNNAQGKQSVDIANLSLFIDERRVEIDGKTLTINRKEYDLLAYFMFNINRLVTKISIAEHVWGDNADQADSLDFVYSQIKNLRKKLNDAKAAVEIESIYGIGYKMVML
jgi:DNA-binding response OmpR family regulator